jgi:hypothetical protein
MEQGISADESEKVKTKIKDWTGDLVDLFQDSNAKAILEAIKDLRTKYDREFNANTLNN